MNLRRFLFLTNILLAIAAFSPVEMARGQAQDSTAADRDDVNVRYAKALLRLAQVELRQASEANKRSAGTYSSATVEKLRNKIVVAEERLKHLLQGGSDLHAVHLRELEGNITIAELNLENALRLNERIPGFVSAVEVERLRLTADVARLAIERARSPAATQSPHDHLQWQLNQLRHEVLRLQIRVAKLESRN